MAVLDISIIVFALLVNMIMLVIGFFLSGYASKIMFFFALMFGLSSMVYFVQNYTVVVIGNLSFTIPFQLFILSWIFLCMIVPAILIMVYKK